MENKYNLTFFEAVKKCLNNEGFIRGENFKKDIFIRVKEKSDGQLILVDGNDFYKELWNITINNGMINQKYKLFSVANSKELELK